MPHMPDFVLRHEIRDRAKLASLAQSMRRHGWNGRRLLGLEAPGSGLIYLVTGTHRYTAAQETDLDVPLLIVEVTDPRWDLSGEDVFWDGERLIDDGDFLRAFLEAGEKEAAALLRCEGS